MPVAFQMRDASTLAVIIDTLDRLGTVVDIVTVTAANQSGSVSDPALADGTPDHILFGGNSLLDPTVTFSGTTMSWAENNAYPGDWLGQIMYWTS